MIVVQDLRKTYRVKKRAGGFLAAAAAAFKPRYEKIEALRGVSFRIGPGEIVAYIGPNGAGKSTTIKVMSGILEPDSGSCLVKGRVPWKERKAHMACIGAVFGQRCQLWWDVPVIDSFDLLRDVYRVEQGAYRRNLEELSAALGIEPLLGQNARSLSLGQRMRCELAASLLHSPDILFLDEPTIGPDAVSRLAVRDFIERENRERGLTVILAARDMHDVEALATRVIRIGKGEILHDGTLASLSEGRGDRGADAACAPAFQAGARTYASTGS